jgi:hypothetical protein
MKDYFNHYWYCNHCSFCCPNGYFVQKKNEETTITVTMKRIEGTTSKEISSTTKGW